MCIIAYYKKGQRPTKERIEHMMRTNPDGVGIAWNTGKRVFFTKGIASVDAVMKAFESIKGVARDVVFHSRIATSGGISAQKCHPYPLSEDADILDKTHGGGMSPVVFHNGVFPVNIESGMNDSQSFIKNHLFPLHRLDAEGLKNGKFDALISLATRGSRLLIMYPDGVRMFGEWVTGTDDGILYSNSNYKPYKYVYTYDDAEWDDYAGWWTSRKATGNASGTKATQATQATHAGTGKKYNAEWWRAHAAKGGSER